MHSGEYTKLNDHKKQLNWILVHKTQSRTNKQKCMTSYKPLHENCSNIFTCLKCVTEASSLTNYIFLPEHKGDERHIPFKQQNKSQILFNKFETKVELLIYCCTINSFIKLLI